MAPDQERCAETQKRPRHARSSRAHQVVQTHEQMATVDAADGLHVAHLEHFRREKESSRTLHQAAVPSPQYAVRFKNQDEDLVWR